jgi:hypothetical protein
MLWQRLNIGSRVNREVHARFWERAEAKFLRATRHSRPGPAGRRSSHVRYAPKATVGHQNAIGRDGPQTDILRCDEGQSLFDHLVRDAEQSWRYSKTK